jgi:hypothetical protein
VASLGDNMPSLQQVFWNDSSYGASWCSWGRCSGSVYRFGM